MKVQIANCKLQIIVAILFVAVLLGVTAAAQAQTAVTPTEAMVVANQYYEEGAYSEAAAAYEAIINFGIRHSAVYYNLGNTYFKMGDLGRVILNYRRALRLAPRDGDIVNNLAVTRAQTLDRLDAPNEGTLANLVQLAEEWLTLQEAALAALGLWLVMCGLMVLAILARPWRRLWVTALVGVGLFLLVGLASMANRAYTGQRYPAAVIVASQVNVTSGPGSAAQYLVEFDLHSGAEVRLLESRPGWRRITLSADLQGWVPEEAVEPVASE